MTLPFCSHPHHHRRHQYIQQVHRRRHRHQQQQDIQLMLAQKLAMNLSMTLRQQSLRSTLAHLP